MIDVDVLEAALAVFRAEDPTAVAKYTEGFCADFAEALHRVLGPESAVVSVRGVIELPVFRGIEDLFTDANYKSHLAWLHDAVAYGGYVFDIQGKTTEEQALKFWASQTGAKAVRWGTGPGEEITTWPKTVDDLASTIQDYITLVEETNE